MGFGQTNGDKEFRDSSLMDEKIIIIRTNNLNDIQLQVKNDETIKDLISKYKSKLQKNNIIISALKNEDGKLLFPDKKLGEIGIKNMSIIYAEMEYAEENNEIYKNKTDDKVRMGTQVGGRELTNEELEQLRIIMKQKYKEGLITLQMHNTFLGTQYFFVNPKVKFKKVAEQFVSQNPGKWFYIFNGLLIDQEETLEKLKIKMLSKILVEKMDENNK